MRVDKESAMDLSFLVMAGGSGVRMGAATRKQYLQLGGQPILVRTLKSIFSCFSSPPETILVVPEEDFSYIKELLSKLGWGSEIRLAVGGSTRYESVWSGLKEVTGSYVAVHDGVRPFVTPALMQRLTSALEKHDAVLPALSATESVRLLNEKGENVSFPREQVLLIQTPQCFRRSLLVKAYEAFFAEPDPLCTDDASIVSKVFGIEPFIVQGEEQNIKITRPQDLVLAEHFLSLR